MADQKDTNFGTGLHPTAPCTWDIGPDHTTVIAITTVDGDAKTISASYTPARGLNAAGIRIKWQSTDLQPPTSTQIRTTTSPSSRSPTPTPTPDPSKSLATSLSGGAKAGIAVAIVIAAVVLFIIGFFTWKRRRPTAKKEEDIDIGNPGFGVNKSELAATESVTMLPRELGSREIVEASSGEIRGPGSVHELEAR